jgi:HAD superfamily hydrolase (TIGR01509 family)
VWGSVREELVREAGGRWHEGAQTEMMGMSSTEWSSYMHRELAVPMDAREISAAVVERLRERYRREVPLLPGAREAVRVLTRHLPLGVASSSNRPLIDLVLERTGMATNFSATVSSEEVARGKPAPDVYLEAARKLGVEPGTCAAVEDSTNGIIAADRAAMTVIAVPRPEFPASSDALDRASLELGSLRELTPDTLEGLSAARGSG